MAHGCFIDDPWIHSWMFKGGLRMLSQMPTGCIHGECGNTSMGIRHCICPYICTYAEIIQCIHDACCKITSRTSAKAFFGHMLLHSQHILHEHLRKHPRTSATASTTQPTGTPTETSVDIRYLIQDASWRNICGNIHGHLPPHRRRILQ